MSFPNIDSFQSRIFKGKWLHLDPPRHLFFFKPKDFFAEMKKYGFNLINQNHYSVEYNPYGMQQSILNCITKKREVLYEYLKGNKDYVKNYSKLNLFLQSMFFKITFPIFVISDLFESFFRKGGVVQFVFRKIWAIMKATTLFYPNSMCILEILVIYLFYQLDTVCILLVCFFLLNIPFYIKNFLLNSNKVHTGRSYQETHKIKFLFPHNAVTLYYKTAFFPAKYNYC